MMTPDDAPRAEPRQRQRQAVPPPAEASAPAAPSPAAVAPPPAARVTVIDRSAEPNRFNTVGAIDGLLGSSVFGWAYDRDFGRRRVKVTMFVNDRLVLETSANGLRRELVGIGSHNGF